MLSESKFLELYRRQQETGLTVKDFCSNEGIAESTFYYWRKKLRKKSVAQNFIPLVVKSSQSLSARTYVKSHPPVLESGEMPARPTGGNDDVLLEVVYPNGTKLRIKKDIDLTHLRALVCLYE
jgi:hypothetical protein